MLFVASLAVFLCAYCAFDLYYVLRRRAGKVTGCSKSVVCRQEDVTIQVPIYNSKAKLLPLLNSIKEHRFVAPIQLLDSSDDGETTTIIERFFGPASTDEFPGYVSRRWGNVVHLHFKEKLGRKAWALQCGIELVSTPFISIFDSDWALSPDFFDQLLPAISADPKIGFVQASWRSSNASHSWISYLDAISVEAEHMIEDVVRSTLHIPFTIHGSAFIVRTDLVRDLGWRDEFLSEDVDLALRICLKGYRAVYMADQQSHGETCEGVTAFFRQKGRWIEGRAQMLRVHLFDILRNGNLAWWRKLFVIHYLAYFLRFPALLLLLLCAAFLGVKALMVALAVLFLHCASKAAMNCLAVSLERNRGYLLAFLEPLLFWVFLIPYSVRTIRGLFLMRAQW